MKGIGRVVQYGFVKESTRGTAVTTGGFWVPNTETNLEEKKVNVVDDQIYGVIEDSVSETRVKETMEGDLKAYVRDNHFGLMLKAILGTENVTTHSGESVVYDHAFTVQQSAQHPSLTVMRHDPLAGQDYVYSNCVVTKLEIDYAVDKFIDYTASIKGNKGSQVPSLTPVIVQENYFASPDLTFKVAATIGALAVATAKQVRSAKITIDETIEDQDVLGSISPADYLNKQYVVTGTLELIWQNEADMFVNYAANTPYAVQLDLLNLNVLLGSTSHPEMRIQLNQCYIEELTKPNKANDLVYQNISFKATYKIADAAMINILLVNGRSTVY